MGHSERLPGIWVWPGQTTKFHIMFSNSNAVYYQQGWNGGAIDLNDMADFQPHNFDIKVYAKDQSCTGKFCAAVAEFAFDGVSFQREQALGIRKTLALQHSFPYHLALSPLLVLAQ